MACHKMANYHESLVQTRRLVCNTHKAATLISIENASCSLDPDRRHADLDDVCLVVLSIDIFT